MKDLILIRNIQEYSHVTILPSIRQHAKKVVSDSPGLVDFVIGLVNSVLNLRDGQVKFLEEFKVQKNCEIFRFHLFILLSDSSLSHRYIMNT